MTETVTSYCTKKSTKSQKPSGSLGFRCESKGGEGGHIFTDRCDVRSGLRSPIGYYDTPSMIKESSRSMIKESSRQSIFGSQVSTSKKLFCAKGYVWFASLTSEILEWNRCETWSTETYQFFCAAKIVRTARMIPPSHRKCKVQIR